MLAFIGGSNPANPLTPLAPLKACADQPLNVIFATAFCAMRPRRASSSSATVFPERGSRRCGATSWSGTRTKARSARRGCGNFESGFAENQIAIEKNVEVERARAVGGAACAVAAKFEFECEESFDNSRGERSVSSAATAFTKRG